MRLDTGEGQAPPPDGSHRSRAFERNTCVSQSAYGRITDASAKVASVA